MATDFCFEDQTTLVSDPRPRARTWWFPQLKGKHKEGINVLRIGDRTMDLPKHEPRTGRGCTACTTEVVFLNKPKHYNLNSYTHERRPTLRPGCSSCTRTLRPRSGFLYPALSSASLEMT